MVGTHSPEIHDEIVARFGSWIVIYNMPYAPDKQLGRPVIYLMFFVFRSSKVSSSQLRQCIRQFLRGAHGEAGVDVAHVRKILERGCFNWNPGVGFLIGMASSSSTTRALWLPPGIFLCLTKNSSPTIFWNRTLAEQTKWQSPTLPAELYGSAWKITAKTG